jgi:GT2 family glycosyltransferase
MDATIVTYQSSKDLARQLNCEPLRRSFDRIVVVDNGSTDGCVGIARRAGAAVVARESNDGYAAAVNAGVRATRSEFVAIMNPDVFFDEEAVLHRLLDEFSDPRVGLASPALRLPGGHLQDSARAVPSPRELALRRFTRRVTAGAITSDRRLDVPWVVGACVVVRRSAFEDVGGFDERYHLYFEDVDFCVRLWRNGWSVRFVPDVTVRHEHRAASRRFGRAMTKHARSALRFFQRHPDLLVRTGREDIVRCDRGTRLS